MCGILFFKGNGDYTFAPRDTLRYETGENIVIADASVNDGRIYGSITIVDWNEDGLLDMLFTSCHVPLQVYINSGSKTNPVFKKPAVIANGAGEFKKYRPSTAIYDINNDGKKDIILGGGERVVYSLNIGTNAAPKFNGLVDAPETDGTFIEMLNYVASPVHGESKITVCNWNNDGFPDLLVGENTGWTVGGPQGYLYIMTGKPGETAADKKATAAVHAVRRPFMSRSANGFTLHARGLRVNPESFELRTLDGSRICTGVFPCGHISVDVGPLAQGAYVVRLTSLHRTESHMIVVR